MQPVQPPYSEAVKIFLFNSETNLGALSFFVKSQIQDFALSQHNEVHEPPLKSLNVEIRWTL